jgi:MFS family permease
VFVPITSFVSLLVIQFCDAKDIRFITTAVGILAGGVIDKLGVRKSLLIGTISSAIARFFTGWTTSKIWASFISLTFFPIGGAFGVPVLALGIRRYSHKDNRKFAFSIFYTMLMLATLLGTMMINQIRGFFPDGTVIWGVQLSWMRIVWMMSFVFTLYTVVCAYFLREIQVIDDEPLEDMKIEPSKPVPGSAWKVLSKIVRTPRFLRLTAVSLIFCGVQMGFRHLDATFPKYMMRTYGANAPWEVILSVNPIVTFFCAPMCTALLIRYKVGFRKALILGAFLSGVSPFFLSLLDSYLGAVLWITVMSFGQAIWGPKLYEYSTMSAPAGREGLFVAITAAPIYLSSVPTGVLSGWMLEHYCPKNSTPEERDNRQLWFWVGVSVVSSPILLWIFRKKLLKRGEDKPPEQATENSMRVGNTDDNGKLPDVPTAEPDDEPLEDVKMAFGNAGAAWAGYDMGGGLSDDSDEDFDEDAPVRSTTSMTAQSQDSHS